MRNERKQENKEDVPLVIAALMDEYGEACTIPETKKTGSGLTGSQVMTHHMTHLQFGEKSDEKLKNQIRKPTTNMWATAENQWTIKEDVKEEHTAKIIDILTGSALSAFGGLSLLNESTVQDEPEGFCAPPIEPEVKPEMEMQWATIARK
jgi:hypothetical protein